MNRSGRQLLAAMLLAWGVREFVGWLGYSSTVRTIAGVVTVAVFYGIIFISIRRRLPRR